MDWNSFLSINPNIYLGLEGLLKDIYDRGEFNVVYLSSSVILSPSSIYSSRAFGVSRSSHNEYTNEYTGEEEEEDWEEEDWDKIPKKFGPEDSEFGFSYKRFLTDEVKSSNNGLFYGNLLIKKSDVIRLCKRWEQLGLAYSRGVSEVRELLEKNTGKRWLAFFEREDSVPRLFSGDIEFWEHLGDSVREIVKKGIQRVDKERVLEEVRRAVKRADLVLDLEINDLLVDREDKKLSPGILRDFYYLSSLDYRDGVPELTEEYIGRLAKFRDRISKESHKVSKVLAFIGFLEGLKGKMVYRDGLSMYRNRKMPSGGLWELEKEVYEQVGVDLLYPETYMVYLPGESFTNSIALSVKRVLKEVDRSSPSEVGLVLVGFSDYRYNNLIDSYEEKGFYHFYTAFVPYIATRQKLAISSLPILEHATSFHGQPVGEPIGYSVDEPYGVSIHLFEKDVGSRDRPDFQTIFFSKGGLMEMWHNGNYRSLPNLYLSSLSPMLDVVVPSREKVHHAISQYFDLQAVASMYDLFNPLYDRWAKERIKSLVIDEYPSSLKKIERFLENAKWDIETLEHAKRLKLNEKSLRKTLELIDELVEISVGQYLDRERPIYRLYRMYGSSRSTKWPAPLELCFESREIGDRVEISLGDLSGYELMSSPLSFLFSRMFYLQGIWFSDDQEARQEARPAEVSKRIADLTFENPEKVLGRIYEILRALGGEGREVQEEEDYIKLVSERTEALKRVLSSGDGQSHQGPKCTLFMEYQPTLFKKAPDHMKRGEDSSEDALILLMTSLFLAVDLEEDLGVVFGLFPIK